MPNIRIESKKKIKKNAVKHIITTIDDLFQITTVENMDTVLSDFSKIIKHAVFARHYAIQEMKEDGIDPNKQDVHMIKSIEFAND